MQERTPRYLSYSRKSAKLRVYRPISLSKRPSKIILKVLSDRLKDIPHDIIDGNQFPFI